MSKIKEVKPPPYPQVELYSDIKEYKIICRHCQKQIDLEEYLPFAPTIQFAVKITHLCGNTFKIVWDGD